MQKLNKNEKEKLMIDMDDVIVSGGLLYLINQYLGTNYTENHFKDFYMQNVIPEKYRQDFFKYFLTKNMYDYCEINSNAYEVMRELNEYYKMCIGTSYLFPEIPRESGILMVYKYNFLLDQFPFLSAKNFAFLTDKSFLYCEHRIDDRLDNLEGAIGKILYTSYHNKDISSELLEQHGAKRADDWLDIKKLLLQR